MKQKRVIDSRFGERLRQLRLERCLTGPELCDLFNKKFGQSLNKCTISRWENNQQEPMLNVVSLLAEFFGVSPVYLMGQSDERQCSASNISNSAVVQGNNASTLIVRNGGVHERELSDDETEILRILAMLGPRERHELMQHAFELEEKQKKREG
jgi:transcriptional regulator with XRE-family HTH domain